MPAILELIGYYVIIGVVFLLIISVLVAAHELGHYWFARLFNMGVEEFSIGFGRPKLTTWMRRTYTVRDEKDPSAPPEKETTDFTVRAWPLGGFVRIKGMVPRDDGSEVHIAGGFYNKPPWQRIIVLLAGPAFSVLAGLAILIPLYATVGVQRIDNTPVISGLRTDSPAGRAGLKPGDRFVAVNGESITTFYDYIVRVRDRGGEEIAVTVERDGEFLNVNMVPEWNEADTEVLDQNLVLTGEFRRQAATGILYPLGRVRTPLPVGQAAVEAASWPVRMVNNLYSLVRRPQNFEKSMGGVITMVAMTNFVVRDGLVSVLQFAALLSISIGIFNLLPVTPLDGGQITVALIEMIRGGRRLSMRIQETVASVGMTLVLALMLSALYVDVKRWFFPAQQERHEIQLADPPPQD
jgi:regulator of sigma E protease